MTRGVDFIRLKTFPRIIHK